jgi:GNAT superfamily N-acetyltransferase
VEIRPVDLGSDESMRAFYATLRSGETYGRVDPPYPTERVLITWFRDETRLEKMTAHAAYFGTDVVGAGFLACPQLDNLEKAWIGIGVPPEYRRRGVGSALVEHLTTQARAADRQTMLAEAWIPFGATDDHPYRRFAEQHGFTLANVEVRRDLALPVSDRLLGSIESEIAPYVGSYRLETHENEIPDELVDSFCALVNLLPVEAPTGDIAFEPEAMTPADLRDREANSRKANMHTFASVGIDVDGGVVAYTSFAVSLDEPHKVHQWGTLVHPKHRGHRLGYAVKTRNLRVLQRDHPEATVVTTCNAEQNPYMVGINERLGYKPLEYVVALQRKLDLSKIGYS